MHPYSLSFKERRNLFYIGPPEGSKLQAEVGKLRLFANPIRDCFVIKCKGSYGDTLKIHKQNAIFRLFFTR